MQTAPDDAPEVIGFWSNLTKIMLPFDDEAQQKDNLFVEHSVGRIFYVPFFESFAPIEERRVIDFVQREQPNIAKIDDISDEIILNILFTDAQITKMSKDDKESKIEEIKNSLNEFKKYKFKSFVKHYLGLPTNTEELKDLLGLNNPIIKRLLSFYTGMLNNEFPTIQSDQVLALITGLFLVAIPVILATTFNILFRVILKTLVNTAYNLLLSFIPNLLKTAFLSLSNLFKKGEEYFNDHIIKTLFWAGKNISKIPFLIGHLAHLLLRPIAEPFYSAFSAYDTGKYLNNKALGIVLAVFSTLYSVAALVAFSIASTGVMAIVKAAMTINSKTQSSGVIGQVTHFLANIWNQALSMLDLKGGLIPAVKIIGLTKSNLVISIFYAGSEMIGHLISQYIISPIKTKLSGFFSRFFKKGSSNYDPAGYSQDNQRVEVEADMDAQDVVPGGEPPPLQRAAAEAQPPSHSRECGDPPNPTTTP